MGLQVGSVPETVEPGAAEDHPHDYFTRIPDRIPMPVLRRLSRLSPARGLIGLAMEWAGILLAVWLLSAFWHPALYVLGVFFIAGRQHALTVLAHDVVHYRVLPSKAWNDWIGDLFMFWPVFGTVEGFREHHAPHHRYLGTENDGNRKFWRTHTQEGVLTREWTYPKSPLGLVGKILFRGCGLTGVVLIFVGLFRMFWVRPWKYVAVRSAYYLTVFGLVTYFGVWLEFLLFWIVPLCTWFVGSHLCALDLRAFRHPLRGPRVRTD